MHLCELGGTTRALEAARVRLYLHVAHGDANSRAIPVAVKQSVPLVDCGSASATSAGDVDKLVNVNLTVARHAIAEPSGSESVNTLVSLSSHGHAPGPGPAAGDASLASTGVDELAAATPSPAFRQRHAIHSLAMTSAWPAAAATQSSMSCRTRSSGACTTGTTTNTIRTSTTIASSPPLLYGRAYEKIIDQAEEIEQLRMDLLSTQAS